MILILEIAERFTAVHPIGYVADKLSKVTYVDRGIIARQLRGWVQSGILKPSEKQARGATGQIAAAMFDDAGICRARLLMALAASGPLRAIEQTDEGHAPRVMNQAEAESTEFNPVTGQHRHRNLEHAVEGTRRGENWVLEIVVVRDHIENQISTSANWLINGRRSEVHVDPLAPDVGVIGGDIEAVLQIPFSKLVLPLLGVA